MSLEKNSKQQCEVDSYRILVHGEVSWGSKDENVDVEVRLSDGRRFSATFFTVRNIERIICTYRVTGECERGLYFWASDMIIVEEITKGAIDRTVRSLLDTGELFSALSELDALDPIEE